jgi:transposase
MGKLELSEKERGRLRIVREIAVGRMTIRKGAEVLGVSYRQLLRVVSRFKESGAEGLGHGLRGRPSNRAESNKKRERILKLYRSKYEDFGPTLAQEYLEREEGEQVGVETLRRWLIGAGLWKPRQQGGRHRAWRERRAHWGELVQMDGSKHDWFEGRRGYATLMVMIDDATNRTYAKFFESETTWAAMEVFEEYVARYGLPRALYVDRSTIYETTRDCTVDEALADANPLTQFGRAMRELGVEIILARSPQAKGRVERRHGVLQDRLVKSMRLKRISDLGPANEYLAEEFVEDLNERFHVAPRSPTNLHRSVPRRVNLNHVLSLQEDRVVQNDWTVSWHNRWLQLSEKHHNLRLARKKIRVSELRGGTLRLTYKGKDLEWRELPAKPTIKTKRKQIQTGKKVPYRPPTKHPWRRRFQRD